MHQNSRFWMSATSRTVIVGGVPAVIYSRPVCAARDQDVCGADM